MKVGETIYALVVVIIALSVFVIIKYFSNNKANKIMVDGSFVIRLPKNMLALGVASILIPLMILLGVFFFDENYSLGDIVFVFCFLGIMLLSKYQHIA